MVVRQADPADQHSLVRIAHIGRALGCIEIEAEIQILVVRLRRKGQGVVIHMAQKVHVVVRALRSAGKLRVLRREDQEICPAQVHDIGALPHAAELFVARHLQFPCELPSLQKFSGFIDQHRAAEILGLGADKNEILLFLFIPDHLGIALVLGVIRPRAEQRLRKLLRHSVLPQHSSAGVGRPHPVLVPVIPRVEDIKVFSVGNGGAGVIAFVVIVPVRLQSDTGVCPVDQVFAGHVIPVLQSVYSAPGTPLVEEMPDPLVKGEPVGIAGKPRHRLNVIRLAVYGLRNPFMKLPDLLGALKHSVPFFSGPFLHCFSAPSFGFTAPDLSSGPLRRLPLSGGSCHRKGFPPGAPLRRSPPRSE